MGDMLNIGTSGLLTAQRSLDTTANNISNVNVPGYNRQVTLVGTLTSSQVGNGFSGAGSAVIGTQRIVSEFILQSMRLQQANLNESESYYDIVHRIDNFFSDPSSSITDGMNTFFNAIQEVTNDPSSIPARQVLLAQSQILQSRFNQMSAQITNEVANINGRLSQNVGEINSISTQLALINNRLMNIGNSSFATAPNDLLDQRDQLILDLSKHVNVSVNYHDNGSADVFIGNGQMLVLGTQVNTLAVKPNQFDASVYDIAIRNGNFDQVITDNLSGGQIGGLINVRQNIIADALNSLGRIALSFGSTFNEMHKKGLDLNGDMGIEMFNDINDAFVCMDRVKKSDGNTGNAVLSVSIDPIALPAESVINYSTASNIVDAGTLAPLLSGMLTINGISISAATLSNDTVSTSDNLGSAIAISNAINAKSNQHLVNAQAQENSLYLGNFTPGALAAGNLAINGVSVLSTGVSEAVLLQDINALSSQTGVMAYGDGNLNITLVAQDGRNIQLTKTAASAAAKFAYFDMAAVGALDKVQRASVKLTSQNDQSITIGGINPAGVGFTAGMQPLVAPSLTTDDYEILFDGTHYSLKTMKDDRLISRSLTPNISAFGFTVTLVSGTAQAGDRFELHPTRDGARQFELKIKDPTLIAVASPIKVDADLTNKGTGKISLVEITNPSGLPKSTSTILGNAFSEAGRITPPVHIQFISDTTYRVFDMTNGLPGIQIGPDQTFDPTLLQNEVFPIASVVDATPPGPNPTYIYDPGYRISLSGIPHTGDTFNIQFNDNPAGDNRNGIHLVNLQFDKAMANQSSTFQESYSQLVGQFGSQTAQAEINVDSNQSLMNSLQMRRNEVSGVNLDEEATNLLQYQQSYQAAAQIIMIARGVFDALLGVMRG